MSCERIGILGGTFDPIHNGHRDIALQAAEEYSLDKLIFMPAGDPYCKRDRDVTPAEHRLEMTRLAVSEMPDICVCSDLEVRTPGRTYTAETLKKLHELYPKAQLYFIAGADSVLYMDSWHSPGQIFENAFVLCAARPGSHEGLRSEIERLNSKYSSKRGSDPVLMLHIRETDISSTEIRRRHRLGEDISAYVSRGVLEYIDSHGLYS